MFYDAIRSLAGEATQTGIFTTCTGCWLHYIENSMRTTNDDKKPDEVHCATHGNSPSYQKDFNVVCNSSQDRVTESCLRGKVSEKSSTNCNWCPQLSTWTEPLSHELVELQDFPGWMWSEAGLKVVRCSSPWRCNRKNSFEDLFTFVLSAMKRKLLVLQAATSKEIGSIFRHNWFHFHRLESSRHLPANTRLTRWAQSETSSRLLRINRPETVKFSKTKRRAI